LDNIVTASSTEALDASDDLSIPIAQDPSIDIQKTPDNQTVKLGKAATFTIMVPGRTGLTHETSQNP